MLICQSTLSSLMSYASPSRRRFLDIFFLLFTPTFFHACFDCCCLFSIFRCFAATLRRNIIFIFAIISIFADSGQRHAVDYFRLLLPLMLSMPLMPLISPLIIAISFALRYEPMPDVSAVITRHVILHYVTPPPTYAAMLPDVTTTVAAMMLIDFDIAPHTPRSIAPVFRLMLPMPCLQRCWRCLVATLRREICRQQQSARILRAAARAADAMLRCLPRAIHTRLFADANICHLSPY